MRERAATQRRCNVGKRAKPIVAERCISWGNVGPPMVPPTYNANLQILQTKDQVVIRHEMMHDVRTISLDGRPHPGPNIQWLAGHSVGRWEGKTLVVDTTNFTGLTNSADRRRTPGRTSLPASVARRRALHAFDENTIRYEFTVEDPDTWTAAWSGEWPLRRTDGPIYEYACHEGNYGLANILRAARVAEEKQRQ